MRILVACEKYQRVAKAFRALGHEAYSCDISAAVGGKPEWHLQQDVRPLLAQEWDLLLAFPPCTDLAVSGARWFTKKQADGRQAASIAFFCLFIDLPHIPKICIENPVGIMSTQWRKPDQIIQPWMFGDSYQKTTCLWLKNLPKLEETNRVSKGRFVLHGGKRLPEWYSNRELDRDATFPGIAQAMAAQWGNCK